MQLVLDAGQHDQLRYDAMRFVTRLGGNAHLEQLEGPIGEGGGDAEIVRQMSGVLIYELLHRGLWPRWRAALHIPRVDTNLLDARGMVLQQVTESMTIDDARHLLPNLRMLTRRHVSEFRPHHFPDLVSRATDLLANQEPPSPSDLDGLIGLALELLNEPDGWPMARDLAFRLRGHPVARRRLYSNDAEAQQSGRNDRRIGVWSQLEPDDWRWLRDQALGPWSGRRDVWDHAYWTARRARDDGRLPAADWQQFVALVEHHMPGLPARFEEESRRHAQERERLDAERREQEQRDPERLPLAEYLQRLLDLPGLAPADRMRRMGHLCAARWWSVGVGGAVQEADLSDALWLRVLDAFLSGLDRDEPSRLPQAEGTAFAHLACSPDYAARLTESMIRRWLPVALGAHISSDWPAVIRGCWSASQAATEQALVQAVADEARQRDVPVLLHSIPSECWTDALTQQVAALARDASVGPRTRRELLEQLVVCCPERADAIAAEWAAVAVGPGDADQLRVAGPRAILVRNPLAAIDQLEREFIARGAAALEELSALGDWQDGIRAQWERWPTNLVERLARLLLLGFPPADDPEFRGGLVTPAHELRHLRGQLLTRLLYQPDAEAQQAVDRLAAVDPSFREWVTTHRALRAGRPAPADRRSCRRSRSERPFCRGVRPPTGPGRIPAHPI